MKAIYTVVETTLIALCIIVNSIKRGSLHKAFG